jgi:hypothetical protein
MLFVVDKPRLQRIIAITRDAPSAYAFAPLLLGGSIKTVNRKGTKEQRRDWVSVVESLTPDR